MKERRNMKDSNRWIEFNSIIDDETLNVKEKGLLLILFRYINNKTGYANPSRALIKKLYGTSKNDVLDKVINSLIDKGYLVRESGNGTRSKYYIKVGTQIEPSTQIEPIVGTQIEPIVGTQIEPQKEKKRKIKDNIYSDFILNVIRKYPGKKVKSIRDKKLPEIIEQYGEEQIGRCIDRYCKEVQGKDKQFILNESTFWNGRYIDYLDENFKDDSIGSSKERVAPRMIFRDSI